jgi:hypothetical protein
VCSYTKKLNVVLTLHNISWDMLNPNSISESSIIDAIAAAAGVPRGNVQVNGVFSSGRRLLQNILKHKVFITVKGAENFNVDVAYSLLNVKSHISWEHGHSVHVARAES